MYSLYPNYTTGFFWRLDRCNCSLADVEAFLADANFVLEGPSSLFSESDSRRSDSSLSEPYSDIFFSLFSSDWTDTVSTPVKASCSLLLQFSPFASISFSPFCSTPPVSPLLLLSFSFYDFLLFISAFHRDLLLSYWFPPSHSVYVFTYPFLSSSYFFIDLASP